MDRFPEAFHRFEQRVPIDSLGRDFRRLLYAFERWAGRNWIPTGRQMRALAEVAYRRGFKNIPSYIWISEIRPSRKVRRYKPTTIRRRKWKRKIRVTKVKKSVKWYVSRKYSANKIQKKLKKRGIGIRRKTLLRYVREAKGKFVKANREKCTPKRYRRR